MGIAAMAPRSMSVAVPFRLPNLAAPQAPFLEERFAVKELSSVDDLRMALANRAYHSIVRPARATALAVQRPLDAGAELVGVVKCSSMASREKPAGGGRLPLAIQPPTDSPRPLHRATS